MRKIHAFLFRFFTGYGYALSYICLILCTTLYMHITAHAAKMQIHSEERFQHCQDEKYTQFKLRCLFPMDNIADAHEAFHPEDRMPRIIKTEHTIYYLRLQALQHDTAYNQKVIATLKRMDLGAPEFFALFEEALTWAEQERTKSPEELYQSAHNLPTDVPDGHIRESFNMRYLLLAEKRGHKQAHKELEKMRADIVESVTEYRKKKWEHIHNK